MLAERLGMTVSELGSRMDSAEFNEWMAYLRIMNSPETDKTPRSFESAEAHAAAIDAGLFASAPKVKA